MATIPVRSYSVANAVIHLAESDRCDVVVLGASREGLLQQVVHGNIPEAIGQSPAPKAIARGVHSTVILVRSAPE